MGVLSRSVLEQSSNMAIILSMAVKSKPFRVTIVGVRLHAAAQYNEMYCRDILPNDIAIYAFPDL